MQTRRCRRFNEGGEMNLHEFNFALCPVEDVLDSPEIFKIDYFPLCFAQHFVCQKNRRVYLVGRVAQNFKRRPANAFCGFIPAFTSPCAVPV